MAASVAFLTVDDLAPFADIEAAKAQEMIDDVTARATLVAPCMRAAGDLDEGQTAAIRAVLRGAVLRWADTGSGAVQSIAVGPYSQTIDTRQQRKSLLWPSEIEELQSVCRGVTESTGAFTVDTLGSPFANHADICSLNFGAIYCSCGAVLAGVPLYEVP